MPEEAESIGIEVVGQSEGLENFPHMCEMGEGRFRINELRPNNATRRVIDGQGKDPFASG